MDSYEANLHNVIRRLTELGSYFKRVTKQMLEASALLANKHIIHRDIKPENILHDKQMKTTFPNLVSPRSRNDTFTPCGTSCYTAPEMFGKISQTPKVNVFSMV